MTVKKIFILLCLIILLCAAKLAYDKYSGPVNAVSREQEEAAKLIQLEADLLRAAAIGRGDYKRPTTTGINTAKIDRPRKTGST
jgi:uncharacterized protein YpmB